MTINGVVGHSKGQAKLTQEERLTVLEMWSNERGRPGFNQETFVAQIAEMLDKNPSSVRRIIAEQVAAIEQGISRASMSVAQRIATAGGATVAAAMEAIERSLDAKTYKVLTSKDGPVLDDQGRIQTVEFPAHGVQLRAAETVLEIFGAWAPKQVELKGSIEHVHMTKAELLERAKALSERMERIQKSIDVTPIEDIEAGAE